MKHLLALAAAALLVTGCAGTKRYAISWELDGNLRVAEPDSASHDYKFYIRAGRDFGVNTENRADRIVMIRSYLEDACSDVTIVDEDFLPTGSTGIGGIKLGTYVSRVKCIRKSA